MKNNWSNWTLINKIKFISLLIGIFSTVIYGSISLINYFGGKNNVTQNIATFIKNGDLNSQQNNYLIAIENYNSALDLHKDSATYCSIANSYMALGDRKNARISASHGHSLGLENSNNSGEACNLLVMSSLSQLPEQSKKDAEKALQIYRDLRNPLNVGLSLNVLGLANVKLGNFPDAINNYTSSINIFDKFNSKHRYMVYLNLGELLIIHFHDMPTLKDGKKWTDKALKGFTQEGDNRGMAGCYGNLAIANSKEKNYEVALFYSKLSLEKFADIGDIYNKSLEYGNIGYYLRYQHKFIESIDSYKKAIKFLLNSNYNYDLGNFYYNIGISYEKSKQHKLACNNLSLSIKILGDILSPLQKRVKDYSHEINCSL